MNNPCCQMQDRIADSILGTLDQQQIDALNEHLETCPKCRQYMHALKHENRLLVQLSKGLDEAMAARQEKVIESLNSFAPSKSSEYRKPFLIWRTIMKGKITKFTAAAVIVVAVLIGINQFGGSVDGTSEAWANVMEAFNNSENIHYTNIVTFGNGELYERDEIWLKNQTLFRGEGTRQQPGEELRVFNTVIDDGRYRLTLSEEDKTAELQDSLTAHGQVHTFEWIDIFRDKKPDHDFDITLLPQESNDTVLVYELDGGGYAKPGKAWIDAATSLPLKVVFEIYREEWQSGGDFLEISFDYAPIPAAIFSTAIPAGYKELLRVADPEAVFGRVVDEYGNPVAKAQVYTSFGGEDTTAEDGDFAIRGGLNRAHFPILLRVFKKDDPYNVGWTIIRHPYTAYWLYFVREMIFSRSNDELLEIMLKEQPVEESGNTVKLVINNENELVGAFPGSPGELYGGEYDSNAPKMNRAEQLKEAYQDNATVGGDKSKGPEKVRDVILVMAPGSVIRGRVRDSFGYPVPNATVTLEEMEMRIGENELLLRGLGSENKRDWKVFAVTDYDGYYELGSLPASWDKATLTVRADSYNTQKLKIKGPGGDVTPDEPQIVEDCHVQLFPK